MKANYLVAKILDGSKIVVTDLSTHRYFSRLLSRLLGFFLEDVGQVAVLEAGTGTNSNNSLSVLEVLSDDLSELGEMPSIPLSDSHGVSVNFLIQVIKETNGLNNHNIHLLRREFELVAAKTVSKTKGHSVDFGLLQARDQGGHLVADTSHELNNTAVVHALDAQLLLDDGGKLWVNHGKLILGVGGMLFQERLEVFAEFALKHG
mmetsp:Transcript_17840/g.44238  ORF Transcript_17840/g.44238 Transcript_17840/m.44238 type:complete len:205 (-) Transcript_17840:244-858(-)